MNVPMAQVTWFCDERGWAYDNRARTMAARLPAYRHRFVYYWDHVRDRRPAKVEELRAALAGADVIVIMCAPYAGLVADKSKVVTSVTSHRILGARVSLASGT